MSSLSFKESLSKAAAAATMAEPAMTEDVGIMTLSAEPDVGVMTLEDAAPATFAAYSGDEAVEWSLDEKYLYYEEYSDENISEIDADKNIALNPHQINITQESNSQYIPFMMPRHYDGFDLVGTTLLIHFVNQDGYEEYARPVNVFFSADKLKFAWLVDSRVTAIEGKVAFELVAEGVTSKGDRYVWKSKPSQSLNVLASLSGNGVIEPDDSWITGFLNQVNEKVVFAQQAANEAKSSATIAQIYAQEASNSAADAQQVVDSAKADLEASNEQIINEKITVALANYYTQAEADTMADNKIATALENYYTSAEVDELFENFDISDQLNEVRQEIANIDGLANFNVEYDGTTMTFYNGETIIKEIAINSDPSAEWTAAYTATVDEKITAASATSEQNLNDYKQTVNADLESIHSTIDEIPEALANDYYTIAATDEKFATKEALSTAETRITAAEANIATNQTDIGTLGNKIGELETTVSSIDTSPRKTYNMTYDAEYKLTLEEIENEGLENEVRTAKSQFVIQGGSGGGTTSILKIEYVTKTPLVVTVNDKAEIAYNFSGEDSSGDVVLEGTATWKVDGTVVATNTAVAGENTFDITDHLSVGTHKVVLSVTDEAGSLVTKSWTVQKIDVRIESNFNDKLTYPLGDVSMAYTPYGAIAKDVHFKLDGKEIGTVTTSASGVPMAYNLPAQEHGSHLVEAYITAEINGNTIESNHIFKDVMWWDSTSTVPVISCVTTEINTTQHATTNIEFTVIDPTTETPTVVLAENGVVVQTLTLDAATHVWQYKSTEIGTHTLTITCGETVKTITANITKLDIDIEPVTAGLVFDFNPVGMSNNSTDRLWSSGDIAMSVSDNFDWINGGYQMDENGDQYFSIKAGTSATINYQMFADDAKRNGKEFKLIFKTANVQKPDATFLHCMDHTTDSDDIGIEMQAQEARIAAQVNTLVLPYSEEDVIEFEFNISANTEDIPMIMGYEDGVSTRPMVYDDSYSFTQKTPKFITLGSDYCDLHIYRLKVYNASLSDRNILNNFIADARSAEEMISRYNRNQIYDENSQLTPESLAEACPWLRVYKLSAPYFTNNKSDKVPHTTIQQIYKDGDPVLDNWTCYDCSHSGQGTSSNNYGLAGRNLDFIMNKSQIEGVDPYFILGDGKTRVTEITQTRNSIPVAYLNAKVNVASSNHMTNAMLAARYNKFNPYNRPFVRDDSVDINDIWDTMEFHNCVIFIQETNEDISTHREFSDCAYHLYAIGNIGSSKKTDKTRLTDQDDPYECCVEIMDVNLPLSDFPVDTMMNAMGYKEDETTHERVYTWAKDENLGILYEKIDGEYILTTDTTVDFSKTYYVDVLLHDDFSEDYTYGWRYISDDEDADVIQKCKDAWIEAYRFITTSTNDEFKEHFEEYFVKDSALFYYLFTMRYCMVDNRSKNLFFHYGKTNEVDSEGNPIRKWDLNWDYDNDKVMSL